ncbi:MAG: lysine--tRNA ligase, partial [FCB group bacterium]|nr:lysine--tRNA ligase [FCB group bacterium]
MSDKPQGTETEQTLNQIIAGRINKLEQIRKLGIEPYPYSYNPTHSTKQALEKYDRLAESETEINLAGRIMSIRNMGKALFFNFQDETGRLQGYVKKNNIGDDPWKLFSLLDLGDIIGVTGTMFTTRTGEKTIAVKTFTLLTKALHPLPEKFHGLTDKETRYRQRYVDLIANPEVRDTFRLRSKIIAAIRGYLEQKGFMEVETPILQPLYGGGIAVPFVTHHNKLDMELYLRIADELYLKRLIVGGFDKVWELCKDFRNEGMDRKHNPEFTMIELYQAYADYHDIMELLEELLRHAVTSAHGVTEIEYEGQLIDFGKPFKRISMIDAIIEEGGPDLSDFDFDRALGEAKKAGMNMAKLINHGKIVESFFDTLVEPKIVSPTFIINHPRDISPLAKALRGEPRLAERFELFIAGMECANAFSELNDPIDQKERFLDQGKVADAGDEEAHQLDHDFINALSYGMPPTGGLGIGVDRIVMIMTGEHSIRDVIFFPQMKPEKEGSAALGITFT